MTAPIPTPPAPAPTPTPPAPAPVPPTPTAPVPAPEPGTGFPAETPLAEMTGEQREAYWRHYARKHEATVASRSDYEQLKADAAKWAEVQRSQQTPAETALREAEERGRTSALAQANESAVSAILRSNLLARGRDTATTDLIMAGVTPAYFVTDGQVDTAKVSAYVDTIAPVAVQPAGRVGGFQGQRGGVTPTSGLAAGRELYAQRHPTRT